MPSTDDLVGKTFGKYQLDEVIGTGAMATVFKAYQENLERWVAVKVLHYKEHRAMVRFEREAKAIAQLRHRNILIVYESGEQEEWPYIVMEYVKGGTLGDRLMGRPMNWAQVVNLLIPVADALHYAHQNNIIHRDVKPSNILLPQPDWPLLADFGLVKLSQKQQETITRTGMSLGTPAYVAPEQARGVGVDHRTDMYALGVILFETVTGRLPFIYTNPNKMLLAHISEQVPLPSQFNPKCPPALETVILTALQKMPDKRYADMAEMIAALQNVLATTMPQPVTKPETAPFPEEPPAFPNADKQPAVTEQTLADLPPSPVTGSHPRILLTDKNVTLSVPQKDDVLIGRSHRNALVDIDLGPYGAAEVGVSRNHARLICKDTDTWLIDDLESLNGTFVNGEKVEAGYPIAVKNGDVIRCSHLSFVFLLA